MKKLWILAALLLVVACAQKTATVPLDPNWKTIRSASLGVSVNVPKTYGEPEEAHETVTFGKTFAVDELHLIATRSAGDSATILRSSDETLLTFLQQDGAFGPSKMINGTEWKPFSFRGKANPTGYAATHNGFYYAITWIWAETNGPGEAILASLEFTD